ncbi:hypothetical protein SAMN06265795_110124 [Noviherbaspirillum humi]|uniref:Nitrogen fixation protein FixH n=1 Tax=Noviherbaspirillum humi TaxID=1688639 RepID=A0A239ITF8_9BURK|nr:FixH family protein [Noviherbaspirillum humi]SNS97066.1 hypothetical protein SAMN06265795_110124 [Noviherbaspirillum humi]
MQTASLPNPGSGKPWYAHRWPWLLALGPTAVVVAGSYTAWLAAKGQDALVVDDYYKQGKAINLDLSRDRAASALGMSTHLAYDPAAGRLAGTLARAGQPGTDAIRLRLVHSTQPGKDLNFLLQPDADGQFSVALPMLEMAHWQVLMESGDGKWRLNGRWAWPQQRTVDIKAD